MIIEKFTLTMFQQNTRVVACEETKKAICIDPAEQSDALENFIKENDFDLQTIALTHAHLDHIGGVSAMHENFPEAEIVLHKADEEMYYNLPMQPVMMGIPQAQLKPLKMDYDNPPKITRFWQEGEIFEVGNLKFKILHTPGHSLGHIILAEESKKKVFVGDCLFEGSIGRTDLPGGSMEQIMDSIKNKIIPLGDDFDVYTGHGGDTTIGRERQTNPFITGAYNIG